MSVSHLEIIIQNGVNRGDCEAPGRAGAQLAEQNEEHLEGALH